MKRDGKIRRTCKGVEPDEAAKLVVEKYRNSLLLVGHDPQVFRLVDCITECTDSDGYKDPEEAQTLYEMYDDRKKKYHYRVDHVPLIFLKTELSSKSYNDLKFNYSYYCSDEVKELLI